jgi:RND family efflux transporter MFP subunit
VKQKSEFLVSPAIIHLLLVGILLAIGLIVVEGCSKRAPAVVVIPPPEVTVSKPVLREITDYYEFPGLTWAVGEVEVRARVLGYIVKVNFEDGQEVKKGDLLFEIDPRPYQAALDRAKGEVTRLQAVQDKAKADLTRSDRLRPSGAISEDEYEQHVSQLAIAKASIRTAEAAVRDAELNLEYTKIVSPIDGRVSRARITEGNLVQPGTGESMILTTVVTVDPIYVYFNIDERALLKYVDRKWQTGEAAHPSRIKDQNIPVEIGLAKEEGYTYSGVLDFIDNKVDSKTGTIRARGNFDNSKQYLTPGLFVRVRIPFGKPREALLVSDRAIGTEQRQKYVLTVNKENVVEYRPVKIGSMHDGLRVIESGIQREDRVIINGLQRTRPGKTVKPHTEEKDIVAASPSSAGKLEKAGNEQATKN